jgi:hypothetical protein
VTLGIDPKSGESKFFAGAAHFSIAEAQHRFRGRCYDSKFSAIFANFLQKMAFFSKKKQNICYDQIFA